MSISPTIKRSQRSESLFELEDLVLKFQAFSPVNEEGDSEKTLDSRTSTRATTVFSSCSSRELKRPTPIIMQTPYGVFSPVTPSDSVREKRFMRISPELPEREVKEEFKVDVYDVKPFGWYSDPKRDPRGHMIAHVMIGKTDQKPRPGDDIEKVKFFLFDLIPEIMAFDHRKILDDYIARYETN